MIVFDCPECGRPMQASEGHAGQQVRCPACQGIVRVPETARGTRSEQPTLPDPLSGSSLPPEAFREEARVKTVQKRPSAVLIAVLVLLCLLLGALEAAAADDQALEGRPPHDPAAFLSPGNTRVRAFPEAGDR